MPERIGHIDAMRAGAPVTVGPVTVLPIERVVLHSDRSGRGAWFAMAIEPHALVVRDAGGVRAVGMGAGAASLDELRKQVKGLDAALAGICARRPWRPR